MITDKSLTEQLLEQLIRGSINSVPKKPIIDFRVLRPYAETGLNYARNGKREIAGNFSAYLTNVFNSPQWGIVGNYPSYQDDVKLVKRLAEELETELSPKTGV